MWIKICANTNLEDARLAADLGADALGFVFAPSKRQVTAAQVAAMTNRLPPEIEKIGVFVTQNVDEVANAVRSSGLTGVQLHTALDPTLISELRSRLGENISITQTVHWKVGEKNNAEEVAEVLGRIADVSAIDRVLIDSKTRQGSGGTGIHFDWNAAQDTLALVKGKVILAGGLSAENVGDGIAILQPWGVDVASGVEAQPGRKDAAKLRAFIRNAR